jgi:hypothetical protein
LILDKSWQPAGLIDLEKCINLIYSGRGEVVKPGKHWISHIDGKDNIPEIIRIPNLEYRKPRMLPMNRRNLAWRDDHTCQYCQQKFQYKDLTIDHVYPKSRFNEFRRKLGLEYRVNDWQNVVLSCRSCNVYKDSCAPEEMGWPKQNPKVPMERLEIDWDIIFSASNLNQN